MGTVGDGPTKERSSSHLEVFFNLSNASTSVITGYLANNQELLRIKISITDIATCSDPSRDVSLMGLGETS